jgi:UDP-3-O-[3-hydroxymyristoyl] glucosamine N-acyltransferase
MPDTRFYEQLGPATLAQLADVAGADLSAPASASKRIRTAAPLSRATDDGISFLSDRRYVVDLSVTRAGACFAQPAFAKLAPEGCAVLLTAEPQAAYARAAAYLHQPRRLHAEGPAVHPSAQIEAGAVLGRGVVVGENARIGAGTEIGANAVIGPGVCIGRDCRVGANVVIGFSLIGDRVRILAGAVIGEAGFGVTGSRNGAIDIPQLGRVIIQDDVTIGACTCIDRGAWDDTFVGERTKIDNLVQIAHNVKLGRNCLLAAHTGISGSVTVGDGAVFGGRAGIADHLEIGAGARVAAAAGVMKSIPAGETWCGQPARPLRRFMRETAWLARKAAAREGDGE